MSTESSGESGKEALADVSGLSASPAEPEEVAALRDRLLRALADAENARRRADIARREGWKAGVAEVVGRLIPGLDSLDLAIRAEPAPETEAGFARAVIEGVRAARRELLEALDKVGVTRIEPEGEPFDAQTHEAVATRPDDAGASGRVLEVLQPGYRTADRLIRPARVVVAQASSASTT